MGTKTADETGAETGAQATTDEQKVSVATTDEVTEAEAAAADEIDDEIEDESADEPVTAQTEGPTGVGQGAGAVVSAALGFVSLTGGWIGTLAAQKESLLSQMHNSQTSNVGTLLKEGYGDVWNTQALYAGIFALVALLVGVFVLIRPAFGAPGKPQAGWIKSVSWAGVSLGVIGLLIAVLKYVDVLVSLPSAN
jgi:VIT1/CCC1 family predicted Fe2+/Mn2+ transporter